MTKYNWCLCNYLYVYIIDWIIIKSFFFPHHFCILFRCLFNPSLSAKVRQMWFPPPLPSRPVQLLSGSGVLSWQAWHTATAGWRPWQRWGGPCSGARQCNSEALKQLMMPWCWHTPVQLKRGQKRARSFAALPFWKQISGSRTHCSRRKKAYRISLFHEMCERLVAWRRQRLRQDGTDWKSVDERLWCKLATASRPSIDLRRF